MSQVGILPGGIMRRPAIRQMVNPLDKCTIFSIYPKRIIEVKPTIEPGRFVLEAGSIQAPTKLIVGTSSWWKDFDDTQPMLEIPQSSIIVANSVVRDYCNGLLGCDMDAKMPGLWFEEGAKEQPNPERMALMKIKQNNWFEELMLIGDILWARTQGNPLSISDDMRLAVQELGIKDKPWLKDFNTIKLVPCKMCGHLRSEEYPMCPNCRHVADEKRAKELGMRFAEVK